MDLQIFLHGTPLISQDITDLMLMVIIIASLLLIIVLLLWHRLRMYEQSKYEFLTIITHKFRTPLTQIKWIVETILEKEKDPYVIESLKNLEQADKSLISLTSTLIELTDSAHSSLATYKLEKLNIYEVTSKIAESLKRDFHEKNLFLGIECSDHLLHIKADRPRIEFILQTLLENAIRYSPPGRNVDINISFQGGKVIVAVRDNGIGILASDMPRIFSKFFRTRNAKAIDTEGFGVALYLAQSVAKRHKGKITAFSDGLNKGSTFTLSLPRMR